MFNNRAHHQECSPTSAQDITIRVGFETPKKLCAGAPIPKAKVPHQQRTLSSFLRHMTIPVESRIQEKLYAGEIMHKERRHHRNNAPFLAAYQQRLRKNVRNHRTLINGVSPCVFVAVSSRCFCFGSSKGLPTVFTHPMPVETINHACSHSAVIYR